MQPATTPYTRPTPHARVDPRDAQIAALMATVATLIATVRDLSGKIAPVAMATGDVATDLAELLAARRTRRLAMQAAATRRRRARRRADGVAMLHGDTMATPSASPPVEPSPPMATPWRHHGDTPPEAQATPARAPVRAQIYETPRAAAGAGGNKSLLLFGAPSPDRPEPRLENLQPSARSNARAPASEPVKEPSAEHADAMQEWLEAASERAPQIDIDRHALAHVAGDFTAHDFTAAVTRHIDETDPSLWRGPVLTYLRRRCEWERGRDHTPRAHRARAEDPSAWRYHNPPPPDGSLEARLAAEDEADRLAFIASHTTPKVTQELHP